VSCPKPSRANSSRYEQLHVLRGKSYSGYYYILLFTPKRTKLHEDTHKKFFVGNFVSFFVGFVVKSKLQSMLSFQSIDGHVRHDAFFDEIYNFNGHAAGPAAAGDMGGRLPGFRLS
jgi:hypothetical protein